MSFQPPPCELNDASRLALKLILEGAIRGRFVEVGEVRRVIEPLAVESQVNPRRLRHAQQSDFRLSDLKR
jgi:hypothetical protein